MSIVVVMFHDHTFHFVPIFIHLAEYTKASNHGDRLLFQLVQTFWPRASSPRSAGYSHAQIVAKLRAACRSHHVSSAACGKLKLAGVPALKN